MTKMMSLNNTESVSNALSALRKFAFTTAAMLPLAGALAFGLPAEAARAAEKPILRTNQSFVEEMTRKTDLDIKDKMAVFAFVHGNLPDEVTVYPSENYYYFTFVHDGLTYAGNLRLDASDRDKGQVHFAYFRQYTQWQRGEDPEYKLMDANSGVKVEKQGKLKYTISFKGRTVTFNLVDLSDVKPPEGLLAKNERYLGPVYDESAIQFFLVFNTDLKIFHYILNETVPVHESFFTSMESERIVIGSRTGFAYYKDKYIDRKILIGVNTANSNVNNYYDGPFDQLPDNFVQGDELEKAILAVAPDLEGKIDRLGNSPGGETRFFIGPYLHYTEEGELAIFEGCASDPSVSKDLYYVCFVADEYERDGAEADEDEDDAQDDDSDEPEKAEPEPEPEPDKTSKPAKKGK